MDAVLQTGTAQVIDLSEYQIEILFEGEHQMAKLAFSCLMQPMIGDRVAVFYDEEQEQYYITAILERPQPDQALLKLKGHLHLETEQLSLKSRELKGQIETVHWFSRLLSLIGRELKTVVHSAQLHCQQRTLTAQNLQVQAEHYQRVIKTEYVQAEVYQLKASVMNSLNAPCTLIQAKNLIKMQSEQVHIA